MDGPVTVQTSDCPGSVLQASTIEQRRIAAAACGRRRMMVSNNKGQFGVGQGATQVQPTATDKRSSVSVATTNAAVEDINPATALTSKRKQNKKITKKNLLQHNF